MRKELRVRDIRREPLKRFALLGPKLLAGLTALEGGRTAVCPALLRLGAAVNAANWRRVFVFPNDRVERRYLGLNERCEL